MVALEVAVCLKTMHQNTCNVVLGACYEKIFWRCISFCVNDG